MYVRTRVFMLQIHVHLQDKTAEQREKDIRSRCSTLQLHTLHCNTLQLRNVFTGAQSTSSAAAGGGGTIRGGGGGGGGGARGGEAVGGSCDTKRGAGIEVDVNAATEREGGDGGGEEPALEILWENIDATMCKAVRAIECVNLLSRALRSLESHEPLPRWYIYV